MSVGQSIVIILVVSAVTFLTRAIPFVVFSGRKETPPFVLYLGKVLPAAIIGMLIVYCLKEVSPAAYPFGLPEILSIALVVVLHIWKRNNLISILSGTVLYMILVQFVFV